MEDRMLVKNPRAIEMISEHGNTPVFVPYSGGGGGHSNMPTNSTSTKVISEDKD